VTPRPLEQQSIREHLLPAVLSVCIVNSVCGSGAAKNHTNRELSAIFFAFFVQHGGHMTTLRGLDVALRARNCAPLL